MVSESWRRQGEASESGEEAPPSEKVDQTAKADGHETTERERELHGLAILALFLHSTATAQEMMAALLEQAPNVTGAVLVYPLILDRKRQILRASVLDGCTDARLDAAMDAFQEDLTALEFSLLQNQELGQILEDGEVALRDGLAVLMEGTLPKEQWRAAEKTLGLRKLALVPMVVESEPLGMVVFAFDQDEIDVGALELLVGHLTLAYRDLVVQDEVGRFSDIDQPTWVHSRRYLMQALESEMTRASRYGRGLSLVLLDIDDFSQFNEAYGQSLGDRLLRTVATTLAETVSPPELVARLKDDDFAVLLPETNRAAAVTTITRLLASLAPVSVFSEGSDEPNPVTLSVAITCFPEDANTPQALLSRAQEDLEAAKQERRKDQDERAGRRSVDPTARVKDRRAS